MTDVQELINRLRMLFYRNLDGSNLFTEAADALDALNRENKTLTEGATTETRRLRRPDKGRLMTTAAPVVTERRLIGPWVEVSS